MLLNHPQYPLPLGEGQGEGNLINVLAPAPRIALRSLFSQQKEGFCIKLKKRKITKETATLKAAVAWYKPNQWQRQRLREISEDRDEIEGTYEEWQALAEKALKGFAAGGCL